MIGGGGDQFMIRYKEDTEIYWNDAQKNLAENVYKRENWTDLFVQWSPLGSYIATMHRQGVAIWGGASFKRLQRFTHPGVRPYPKSITCVTKGLGIQVLQ